MVSSPFFSLNNLLIEVCCCCTILDGREVGIVSLIYLGCAFLESLNLLIPGKVIFGGLEFIDTREGSASFALPLRQIFGLLLSCSCCIL